MRVEFETSDVSERWSVRVCWKGISDWGFPSSSSSFVIHWGEVVEEVGLAFFLLTVDFSMEDLLKEVIGVQVRDATPWHLQGVEA